MSLDSQSMLVVDGEPNVPAMLVIGLAHQSFDLCCAVAGPGAPRMLADAGPDASSYR